MQVLRRVSLTSVLGVLLLSAVSMRAQLPANLLQDTYGSRGMYVYVPSKLPASGSRGMVIVLHGGLGNAERIAYQRSENGLNMDAVAERDGFVVAYLNGTPVTRMLGANALGWNAGGGCCGLPFQKNVNDVAYIQGAVAYLAAKYGVDRARVYGMGHSNGAMMAQRLACETTVFATIVSIAGPLNADDRSCPAASGKTIYAIHGAEDQNVPIAGGVGAKGLSHLAFQSEEHTRQVYTRSGATYKLQVVPGADHAVANLEAAIEGAEERTIAEKAAAWFGLAPTKDVH